MQKVFITFKINVANPFWYNISKITLWMPQKDLQYIYSLRTIIQLSSSNEVSGSA